jgi:integrase
MPFRRPANRLTTTSLAALAAGPKSYDVTDLAVTGLLLRVAPTGQKSWLFRFKWKTRASRIKIGVFPMVGIAQARELALNHRRELEKGIDPRQGLRPGIPRALDIDNVPDVNIPVRARTDNDSAISVNGLAGSSDPLFIPKPPDDDKQSVHFLVYEFVEFYVKPNREVPQEVIRILKKDVLPYFVNRDARTVTSREITDRLDSIVARDAPVMANRTAPIISQMFAFGVHRSIVLTNPVSLLFKPGGKERPCKRVLSEVECHAFIHGVEFVCIAPVRFHTLMVLLLTLVRIGSLAKAEWIEFNFERKEWRIPAAHDKERREHIVPLTDWAIVHLLELKKLSNSSPYVLPKQRTDEQDRPCSAQIISRSLLRLRNRFEVIGIAPFTPHDIRRTGRTFMSMLNVDINIAELVLNHFLGKIIGVYDLWEFVPQKREALEKLGAYYASLFARAAPSPNARERIRLWKMTRQKGLKQVKGKSNTKSEAVAATSAVPQLQP